MSEADISPLAKRLAEENNVDWRKLRGSGADGKVVERDVLEYLARVMSGQEDMDPTPEPLPEGMEEWPEEDIAAYRRGARDRAQARTEAAPAPEAAGAQEEEEEIDEDIFLFEDEDTAEVSEYEDRSAEPDVFAVSGGEEISEDEDLFLDLSGREPEVEAPRADSAAESLDWRDEVTEEAEEEPEADRGFGLDSMAFELEEPTPPPSGGAAVERTDVRDLDFVAGADAAAETAPAAEVPVEETPTVQAPVEQAPVAETVFEERRPQVEAKPSEVPLVRYGLLLRRHLDLTAVHNAQSALGRELGMDEPLPLSAFLVRAAAKALRTHPLGAGGIALAEIEGGLRYLAVSDPVDLPFRELASSVRAQAASAQLPDGTALVVVDLSDLEIDEAVLNVGAPVLALGRVLYDDEAGGVRGTLSISGDVEPEAGGRVLTLVADLLGAPVRLLI